MFYLIFAVITSSIIFVLFKIFSIYKVDVFQAITINYLVAAFCGYCSSAKFLIVSEVFSYNWLVLAVISGFFLITTFYIYGISTQKVGIAITSVAGKMSVVIPVLVGFIMFSENFNGLRITGIVIALVAFYFTMKRTTVQKTEMRYLFLPFLLFLGNGINDSVFKIAQQLYIKNEFTDFLTIAFFVSLLIGILVMIPRMIILKLKFTWISLLAGVILGLFNWYSTYFFLVGLSHFDVSVFVPVFNVCIVAIAAIIGFIFYKEKLSVINFIGIFLAIISIILMAGIG